MSFKGSGLAPAEFLNALIPDNAVARTELAYQQRSSRTPRRWWSWIGRGLHALIMAISVILFLIVLLWSLGVESVTRTDDHIEVMTWALGAVVVIYHFILMFRTVVLSSNSLVRETHNNTWEMLVLTGINSEQIAQGKWSGTVRNMWRQYALLGVMRAGVAVWYGAYSSRDYLFMWQTFTTEDLQIAYPSALHILVGGLSVWVLTMVNLPFTAACGVLASAQVRRNALAIGRAFGVRLLSIFALFFCWLIIIGVGLGSIRFPVRPDPFFSQAAQVSIFNVLDNGASTGVNLGSVVFYSTTYGDIPPNFVAHALAVAVSIGLYGLTTGLILRMAQQGLSKELALPPPTHRRKLQFWKRG